MKSPDGMTEEELKRMSFHFDGLSYSYSMASVAFSRLVDSLNEIHRLSEEDKHVEELIASVLLDAWSLIDVGHRIRELLQSTPRIPKRLPAIQIFLRATEDIEEMRHYVQHFRSGIPKMPPQGKPLWGALSWVPDESPNTCLTIASGSLQPGTGSTSISYDRIEQKFTKRIVLSANDQEIDLERLAERIADLRLGICQWIDDHTDFTRADRKTLVYKVSLQPNEAEQAEDTKPENVPS